METIVGLGNTHRLQFPMASGFPYIGDGFPLSHMGQGIAFPMQGNRSLLRTLVKAVFWWSVEETWHVLRPLLRSQG